jgi:endonuclease I
MKHLRIILPLLVLVSCGKHTFDKPQGKTGGFNSQIQGKKIVLISEHENSSDYYPSFFHEKYLDKIANSETFNDKEKSELKSALNDILRKDHVRKEGQKDQLKRCTKNSTQSESCYAHSLDTYRDYKMARTYLYGLIDLKTNASTEYYLDTIYCQRSFTNSDLSNPSFPIGPMTRPDYNTINAEHVWPRSKFDEPTKETDYYNLKLADLHNLFPSFVKTNQERWNFPFNNYNASTDTIINDFSKFCATSTGKSFKKNGQDYFEAPDNVKGDIARAMFYMSARHYYYKKPKNMNIDAEQEAVLRAWHKLDPVTQEERNRNDRIFKVQHNRNPFVDFPELVDVVKDF